MTITAKQKRIAALIQTFSDGIKTRPAETYGKIVTAYPVYSLSQLQLPGGASTVSSRNFCRALVATAWLYPAASVVKMLLR